MDESGVHLLLLFRAYGYERKGRCLPHLRQYLKGEKLNLLLAIKHDRITAFHIIKDNTTTADFIDFIVEKVLPNVPVGSVVILDNASIHKSVAGIYNNIKHQ